MTPAILRAVRFHSSTFGCASASGTFSHAAFSSANFRSSTTMPKSLRICALSFAELPSTERIFLPFTAARVSSGVRQSSGPSTGLTPLSDGVCERRYSVAALTKSSAVPSFSFSNARAAPMVSLKSSELMKA